MLRIAIQAKGRLNEDTMALLADAGIEVAAAKRKLRTRRWQAVAAGVMGAGSGQDAPERGARTWLSAGIPPAEIPEISE